MTREEAIKRLKEARSTIQPFRYVDEAIDYAIKALEQEPCDDCVSRQEVNALVEELRRNIYDERSCMSRDAGMILSDFYDLPSVLPEREQGKWSKNVDNGFRKYKCSKCHNFNDFNSKYCPHCGAEMVIKSCSTCKHDGELVCATHGCHNKEKYEVK